MPCPSLSDLPPIAKIAKPMTPNMPRIGAERLVIAAGAPSVTVAKNIDSNNKLDTGIDWIKIYTFD